MKNRIDKKIILFGFFALIVTFLLLTKKPIKQIKNEIMNKLKPRGLRNNNPMNIKKSSQNWQGKIKGNDNVFETFENIEYGVRAAIVVMHTYYYKHGCNTITKIINRLAPTSENNTQRYIEYVQNKTFINKDLQLMYNLNHIGSILKAIFQYENGIDAISIELIKKVNDEKVPTEKRFK